MDLKSLLSKDANKKEYFWSLVIEPNWIQAGIWTITDGKAEVVATSPPSAWESDEELVSSADTALSTIVSNLPEDADEPSKTVFGVSSNWVKDGEIKKEFLAKLKKLCSELSLQPTGFVTLPEAISHFVKTEEGSPLSAVLVGITNENLEVSVFRLGRLVGTSHVARSVSVFDDVIEGLTRFASDDNLPSRFILYDGKEGELEDARQSLLSSQWDELEKIKFLHTPKVELFNPEKKVIAVSLGGASEMGGVTGVAGEEEEETKQEDLNKEEVENVQVPTSGISAQDVGFVVGEDIKDAKVTPNEEGPQEKREDVVHAQPQPDSQQVSQESHPQSFKMGGITNFFSKLKISVTAFFAGKKLPEAGSRTFLFGGIFFVVVLVGLFLAWWFLPKATVTIYVSPKKLDEKVSFTVDSSASSVDFGKKTLPGKTIKTSVSGDKTKSTSGTKTVGEKAKGTVEIRNGTSSPIRFSAGTTIASSNLEFTLDNSASVSAALSPGSPGTATVDVTASDIGAEYNLGKDETFSVSNYPKAEVDAVAQNDFSGGSSREISAVSESDQKTLLDDLTAELKDKAKSDLISKVGADETLIDGSLVATPSAKQFSNKVGDEADTLKLSLDLDVDGVVVKKQDLFDLANEILKGSIPQGFVLRQSQMTTDLTLSSSKNGKYQLDGSIGANLLPEINTVDIANNIKGKYPDVAENYLMTIPSFARAVIKRSPPLPGKLGSLPRLASHITVEVQAEK
jgi:hypothetical protein